MNLAPLPRDFLSTNVICSPVIPNSPACEQCFSPRADTFSPESCQRSFGQAAPQFLKSPLIVPKNLLRTPTAINESVMQSIPDRETQIGLEHSGSPHTICVSPMLDMAQALNEDSPAHKASFWDSLDCEDRLSTHSTYSALSNIKVPFSRAWNLRKERSLIFYPHQLFSFSTVSIQQKLKRRPRSVAALKCASYAKPIADLPNHLSQIGNGIGYTYKPPALSQPMVAKTRGTSYSDSDTSSCPVPIISRDSTFSENTVAVPNACHGLFRSLSISNFWTGLKNGSGNVPVATMLLPHSKRHCAKILGKTDDIEEPLKFLISGPYKQSKEEDCGIEIGQPLAESTAFLSPVLEASSSTISCSPTRSATTEGDVLTPETQDFPPAVVVRKLEIAEMESSEEAHQFCPESTLRLVTPMNGLRLALAGESYLP